jgi:hypothetical protein
MKYRNRETGVVSTDREIKAANSNVSFGPNTFDDLGYDVIFLAPKPSPSTALKTVVHDGEVQDANGNWTEAWLERDMFSDTTEDGVTTTKAEHEAAYTTKMVAEAATAAQAASKVEGIEILGVMCSATKKDQTGMLAVGFNKLLADMAGQAFPSTKFEFENGTELVITNDNYAAIQALWVPFRQSFFTAS